jgi:excisionase family DNA binding protein
MNDTFPWSFRLATAEEVCKYFRINQRTLYRLMETGRLTGFKVGGVWRFRPQDLERYLESVKAEPGRLFYPSVLQRYFDQPQKYKIIKKDPHGWLVLRKEYLRGLTQTQRAQERFTRFKYAKRRPKLGISLILVMPRAFGQLPPEEQEYWRRFEVT